MELRFFNLIVNQHENISNYEMNNIFTYTYTKSKIKAHVGLHAFNSFMIDKIIFNK